MLQQPLRQTAYSSESVLTTVPHLPSRPDSFLLGVSVSPTKLCCSNKQSPNLRGIQQQGCMSHSHYLVSAGHCISALCVLFILEPGLKELPPSGKCSSCGRVHRTTSSFLKVQHVTYTLFFFHQSQSHGLCSKGQ